MSLKVRFDDGDLLNEYPELFRELIEEESKIRALPWNYLSESCKEVNIKVYRSPDESRFSYTLNFVR